MTEKKNACIVGDRVELNDQKGTQGIVIDLDLEGFENMPRAFVFWSKDTTIDQLYLNCEKWVCEGNLTIMHDNENLLHRHYPEITQ